MFTTSTNRGASLGAAAHVERGGDRGYYSAPAISPNGTDVWLVYNAFEEPFKTSAVGADERPAAGRPGPARDGLRRRRRRLRDRAPRCQSGDARGSSQNDLAAEFLGDYVYAAATRSYGVSVWNDVRDAADCGPVDQYRQDLHDEAVATGSRPPRRRSPAARATRARTPPVAPSRRPSSRCARPPSATPTSSGGRAWRRRSPSTRAVTARGLGVQPSGAARVIGPRCPNRASSGSCLAAPHALPRTAARPWRGALPKARPSTPFAGPTAARPRRAR